MYLLATPVQGDMWKVQVFIEGEYLMMRTQGFDNVDAYQRKLRKQDFVNLQKQCTWDESFTCWKAKVSMQKDADKSLINVNIHNRMPRSRSSKP